MRTPTPGGSVALVAHSGRSPVSLYTPAHACAGIWNTRPYLPLATLRHSRPPSPPCSRAPAGPFAALTAAAGTS